MSNKTTRLDFPVVNAHQTKMSMDSLVRMFTYMVSNFGTKQVRENINKIKEAAKKFNVEISEEFLEKEKSIEGEDFII